MKIRRYLAGLPAALMAIILLTSCAAPGGTSTAPSGSSGKPLSIGFFGAAAANSFSQAVFKGVKEAAVADGSTATFVDGNFSGPQQVQQINDAITSKQFDIIIISANDNLVVQDPLERAIKAGITVVVEFTPVGPNFDSIEPQIPGAISIVDPPVGNGKALGQLGIQACATVTGTCNVAYLEGFRSLPLDNARTTAVLNTLKAAPNINVVGTVEGGYTTDQGRTAFQNISQANPNINVVIGSSQAIAGAVGVADKSKNIKFVANGAPESGVEAVKSGKWFAIYALDVVANGKKAAELGLGKARGQSVPTATRESDLAPNNSIGTKDALEKANFHSGYDD